MRNMDLINCICNVINALASIKALYQILKDVCAAIKKKPTCDGRDRKWTKLL